MKAFKHFVILAALIFSLQTISAQQGIQFEHGTWSEVLAKAAKEDKVVFVDAYTTWCGPCKWMSANTFTEASVGAYYNTEFINYKLDMEKGEGLQFAKDYQVDAYPSLIFVDARGDLVQKTVGALPADKFLELGKRVKKDGMMSLSAMVRKFESGDYDRKFLHGYLLRVAEARLPYKDALEAYRPYLAGSKLMEKESWEIFHKLFKRTDTEEFKYFEEHQRDFINLYGKDVVQKKVVANYSFDMFMAIREQDDARYKSLRKEMKKLDFGNIKEVVGMQDLSYYQAKGDWKKYAKSAVKTIDNMEIQEPGLLNNVAWTFYEKVEEKKHLEKAVNWAKTSVELAPGYYNMDTYAMLLYKVGRIDEAKAAAKAAIAKAKEEGEDASATQKALDKM